VVVAQAALDHTLEFPSYPPLMPGASSLSLTRRAQHAVAVEASLVCVLASALRVKLCLGMWRVTLPEGMVAP
jgi:hypothetical protein